MNDNGNRENVITARRGQMQALLAIAYALGGVVPDWGDYSLGWERDGVSTRIEARPDGTVAVTATVTTTHAGLNTAQAVNLCRSLAQGVMP